MNTIYAIANKAICGAINCQYRHKKCQIGWNTKSMRGIDHLLQLICNLQSD